MYPYTFSDLVFKPHPMAAFDKVNALAVQGLLDFPNGYGLSVVSGRRGLYCDPVDSYEVAIRKDGRLCYTTPFTDDVLGYVSPEEVNTLIGKIQHLNL